MTEDEAIAKIETDADRVKAQGVTWIDQENGTELFIDTTDAGFNRLDSTRLTIVTGGRYDGAVYQTFDVTDGRPVILMRPTKNTEIIEWHSVTNLHRHRVNVAKKKAIKEVLGGNTDATFAGVYNEPTREAVRL